jgi:hypothetical protein
LCAKKWSLLNRQHRTRTTPWPALLVFALFALFALLRAPVPAVNEPHYLTKARHFYDVNWCAGDLFLESSNAHWTFYAALGWLTRFLTFEQTAWVGRIFAWCALAWGWTLLARLTTAEGGRWFDATAGEGAPVVAEAPGSATRTAAIDREGIQHATTAGASPAWSAAIFLGISATGTLSGEWLIGGVEAKCFSYAFLFAALYQAGHSRLLSSSCLLGLAVAWHPVVGGWGAVALGMACAWRALFRPASLKCGNAPGIAAANVLRPLLGWRALAAAALFAICAAPGLLPGLAMLRGAPSAEIAQQAARIQVYDRLDHHLDPLAFSAHSYAFYAGLAGIWLALAARPAAQVSSTLLDPFVAGCLMIACAGMLASQTAQAALLLRFYPFRLLDLMLPVAVALRLAERMAQGRLLSRAACWLAAGAAFLPVIFLPAPDRQLVRGSPEYLADWRGVCEWARDHTAPRALFLTPKYLVGFKWVAERPEYATWKDCPQDAQSLVEWKRRLDWVRDWRQRHFQQGFGGKALKELRQATGVDYVLARVSDPYLAPALYRNASFAIYALREPHD